MVLLLDEYFCILLDGQIERMKRRLLLAHILNALPGGFDAV